MVYTSGKMLVSLHKPSREMWLDGPGSPLRQDQYLPSPWGSQGLFPLLLLLWSQCDCRPFNPCSRHGEGEEEGTGGLSPCEKTEAFPKTYPANLGSHLIDCNQDEGERPVNYPTAYAMSTNRVAVRIDQPTYVKALRKCFTKVRAFLYPSPCTKERRDNW